MEGILYISIEEAKSHLNIDPYFTDDDKYILSLIEAALRQVTLHLNGNSIIDENGDVYPEIKHAMLLLIGTLYTNRESVSYASNHVVNHAYDYLLLLTKSYDYDFS